MFRILIADDEGIMRESIKNTIEANFGSETEIVTVKTGREVVEQAESFRPDIAFVDIQMPGLSGIQAIKEIKKFNSSIVFVVITAYDNFSYAKESVNLGVMEYILKPVNKQKIIDVCIRAKKKTEELRQKRSDDLRIKEKLEIVIPMLETAFINNMLQESGGDRNRNYLNILDIDEENGYVIVFEYGDDFKDGNFTNAVGSNVKMNNYYKLFKETLAGFFQCVTGPVMGNRIIAYVPTAMEKVSYEARNEIISRGRSFVHKIEEELDMKFRAGIGGVKNIDMIYESYTDALKCLMESDKHIVHVMDMSASEDKGSPKKDLRDIESRYLAKAMKGDTDGALSVLNGMIDTFGKAGDISEIRIALLELMLSLERKAGDENLVTYDIKRHESYMKGAMKIGDIAELKMWAENITTNVCTEILLSRNTKVHGVVGKAVEYIKDHYADDLSLDDVARQVDISPYYFSKLFKQETGDNFIEFLTGVRIGKAKEYLSGDKYSIKEICSMCGYTDPNYFSRTFKKYEGVTPTEFREKG